MALFSRAINTQTVECRYVAELTGSLRMYLTELNFRPGQSLPWMPVVGIGEAAMVDVT